MPLTIAERRAKLDLRKKQMQQAINLRAEGKVWAEIAELIGVNSHQRAMQLHQAALLEGMTHTKQSGNGQAKKA